MMDSVGGGTVPRAGKLNLSLDEIIEKTRADAEMDGNRIARRDGAKTPNGDKSRPRKRLPDDSMQNRFRLQEGGIPSKRLMGFRSMGGMSAPMHDKAPRSAPVRLSQEESAVLGATTSYNADSSELYVSLKNTSVVRVEVATGNVILNSGGWRTHSTLSVINAALKPIGLWVRPLKPTEITDPITNDKNKCPWEVCGKWFHRGFEDNMVSRALTLFSTLVAAFSFFIH
eukprot:Selendium_serpulae@DN3508_c0_g1_i10.p1